MSIESTVSSRTSTNPEAGQQISYVGRLLPWALAAGALMFYCVTLNHWVTLSSLFPVANVSGWTQPDINHPLYWLVTYPLRWLPVKLIPLALNLLSAVWAAGVIGLLARSVALLPQDRTQEQRIRERSATGLLSISKAWLPPVLAVMACGLQLSFWENATAGSSEMLDLLIFAYVIRCLLEFRLAPRDSWLLQAAAVYAADLANNWAMVGFLPVFIVALIWVKGLGFFNLGFLARMFLATVPGLLLYLLMPLVTCVSPGASIGFWPALKQVLVYQKQSLAGLPFNRYALMHGFNDRPLWVLALPSLLPVLVMAIRWPSYLGEISKMGVTIAKLAFHVVHGALLLVCLWVALDPAKFSARQLLPQLPLLTFYYLGSLSIGYFIGYFLLVFGKKPVTRWPRPEPFYGPALNRAVQGIIWAMLVVTPVFLLYRNIPQIRATNGPMLRNYSEALVAGLPAQNSALLSDDPVRLTLVEAALASKSGRKDNLFVNTGWLNYPEYHGFLSSKYPGRWPFKPGKDIQRLSDLDVLQVIYQVAESNSLFYLNPSFGYFFEVFYQEPIGPVYKLKRYSADQLLPPAASAEVVKRNEEFWRQIDETQVAGLLRLTMPHRADGAAALIERVETKLHLSHETNPTAMFLERYYSRALNYWGVQLQASGRLKEAAAHFERAMVLNPENIVARINLQCNQRLQAGQNGLIELRKEDQDDLNKYRNWDQLLTEDGPFDEALSCFQQGQAFVAGRNYRQAAREFARVRELVPENLASRIALGQIAILHRLPDNALKLVEEIRQQAVQLGVNRTNITDVMSLEAAALIAKRDTNGLEAAIQRTLTQYPGETNLLGSAAAILMDIGEYTNALPLFDEQLRLDPDNASALVNKGYAYLRLNAYDQALPPLSRVVQMDTNSAPETLHYSALYNRAIAYLKSDQLDLAQADYDVLQRAFPKKFQFYYGPGEIAYRKHDTNAAIRNYELYLANAPTNSLEASNVIARLQELKGAR